MERALLSVPAFGSSTIARIRLRLCVVSSPPQRFRQPKACAHFPQMRRAFSLRGERRGQPEVWAPSPQVRRTFSLRGERPRQPEAWAPSPQMRRAFSLRSERPRQPEACAHSPRVRRAFSLHSDWLRQPEAPAPSPWVRCVLSLRSPSAHRRSGLRKSLDRNRGLFAVWEGVASLGLSLPLSPPRCLLPPAGMGQLFSGFSVPLFCEPLAVCSAG